MIRALSFIFLFIIWQIGAWLSDPRRLPGPFIVAETFIGEAQSGALLTHLLATTLRVSAAFLLAMSLGTAIGYMMGRIKTIDRLLDPWTVVLLNIPALVVIVLSYIWFGLTETAAIGAVALNKLPNVIITIREGARSLSHEFEDLATVFNFSMMNRLRHIIIPQLGPYIAATMRTGLSLVWKLVLIVELLGRSNGIGFQINLAFQLFDMRLLLAYALPFIAFMLIIETFLVQPFEQRVSRWRSNDS